MWFGGVGVITITFAAYMCKKIIQKMKRLPDPIKDDDHSLSASKVTTVMRTVPECSVLL